MSAAEVHPLVAEVYKAWRETPEYDRRGAHWVMNSDAVRVLAELSGNPIPPDRPVPRTGSLLFQHEVVVDEDATEVRVVPPIRKVSALIPVSEELAADHAASAHQFNLALRLASATPQEKATREATLAATQARNAAYKEALVPFREALAQVTDPVARTVLDLHDSTDWCPQCGDNEDGQSWPCDTVEAVAEALGIEVPTW